MQHQQITLEIGRDELEYLQQYARENGMTVSDLVDRLVRRFRSQREIHPEIQSMSGIVPDHVNGIEEYREHQERRHS